MPKAFLLDSGLRNSLLNNFQSVPDRLDKGASWETALSADGNEVAFVLPEIESLLMRSFLGEWGFNGIAAFFKKGFFPVFYLYKKSFLVK